MNIFSIVFTRCLDSQRVISQPVCIYAEDIDAALDIANYRLTGMNDADQIGVYAVVSVTNDSYIGTIAEHLSRNMFDVFDGEEDAG